MYRIPSFSLSLSYPEPSIAVTSFAFSPAMKRMTVRAINGCRDILVAYASASLSSGPPMKNMAKRRRALAIRFDSTKEMPSPRSTKTPTDDGELPKTLLFTILTDGLASSVFPSKGRRMRFTRFSAAIADMSSCMVV